MTTHKRETTIGRKLTEEEAAHIERGAVYLAQTKWYKFFSSINSKQLTFYVSLRTEGDKEEFWMVRNYELPFAGFKGVDDSIYKIFVRFATEEECERFNMPYVPEPAKPTKSTHLKVVKD